MKHRRRWEGRDCKEDSSGPNGHGVGRRISLVCALYIHQETSRGSGRGEAQGNPS